MKRFLVVIGLMLAAIAGAADALILISPERARPVVDENSYVQGEWLLWPAEEREGSPNRLLSLLTGMDWSATGHELIFRNQAGQYLSTAWQELRNRGYFAAREKVVTETTAAITATPGVTSPVAALLALDASGPAVRSLPMGTGWPAGFVVAEADSWDRVAAIVHNAGGRALVVEYPPLAGQRWSRYWLRGAGWGSSIPTWKDWNVPGLVPSSQAGNLLFHREKFIWRDNDAENWGGANRWLSFIRYASPLTLAILSFVAAFFAGCSVYLISREEHARFAAVSIKYMSLLPAAVLFAGQLTRALGYSGFAAWMVLAFLSLVFAAQVLGGFCRIAFPNTHEMLPIAALGFAVAALSPPLWSMYSNVLNVNVLPLSPESSGALFAYLVGMCAFARGSPVAAWIARAVAVLAFAWGIGANPWWVSGEWPFALLPLVALFAGERMFRPWMLVVFALIPLADGKLVSHGFVWAPGNLFPTYGSRVSVNLARYVEFLVSHGFLGTLAVTGAMAIFVERYFFHELRRTLLRDSRVKIPFQAALACLAMALFQPLLLYPALICFVGGVFVVLTDTARAV